MPETLTPLSIFKCLADDTRVRIALLVARQGELCVCELTAALEQSQPKISRHLAQLRNCGLLEDERRGQWVYYRLHPGLPDWVRQMLSQLLTTDAAWLQTNIERVEDMCAGYGNPSACAPSNLKTSPKKAVELA